MRHFGDSISRVAVGFVLGAVPGVAIGLAMGLIGWVRAKRNRRLTAGVLALVVAVAGTSLLTRVLADERDAFGPGPTASATPSGPPVTGARPVGSGPLNIDPLPRTGDDTLGFRLSDDGQFLLYRSTEGKVFRARPNGGAVQEFPVEGPASSVAWSPSTGTVVYATGQSIWTSDLFGESVEIYRAPREVWQPVMSPDGSTVLFTMAEHLSQNSWVAGLWSVPTSGDAEATLLIPNAAYGEYSPDGTTIAYHAATPNADAYCGECWWVWEEISLASADGDVIRRVKNAGMIAPPQATEHYAVRWSPDGTQILSCRMPSTSDGVVMPGRIVLVGAVNGEVTKIGTGTDPSWVDDDTIMVGGFEEPSG
jgi:hypothetical protein